MKHSSENNEQKGNRAKNRPKRKPLAGRDRLTAPQRAGYVRRFVNANPERVQAFKDAGYEVVTGHVNTGDSEALPSQLGSVTTADGGLGTKLVLMEIPEEYYNEDQEAKQTDIEEKEKAMFAEQNNREGHYGSVKRSVT